MAFAQGTLFCFDFDVHYLSSVSTIINGFHLNSLIVVVIAFAGES